MCMSAQQQQQQYADMQQLQMQEQSCMLHGQHQHTEQEQLQIQMQLAHEEELAFQQQLYEQGWDQLSEDVQQQLRQQFHAEFLLQIQQQEQLQHELAHLQAAYPDIDPAILQEQLMQQFMQQAQEQQAYEQQQQYDEDQQQQVDPADPAADVYEQHLQYEHLQQQLAGLQLPEHVQWMIHQHQQQQQEDEQSNVQALPLQSQEFVPPAVAAVEGGEEGPLLHVLDGPNGQVVQVTPGEFQDILTVMQALAGTVTIICSCAEKFCHGRCLHAVFHLLQQLQEPYASERQTERQKASQLQPSSKAVNNFKIASALCCRSCRCPP